MTRSIPEKTLEHWTSMYIVNRFPNSSLWWPTDGEDVAFDLLQTAAGGDGGPAKVLLLELKTTEWVTTGGGSHRLTIDCDQLDKYIHSPRKLDLPVFYVFPVPFWDGVFSSPTTAMPVSSTWYPPDWWRQAADYLPGAAGYEWFANWLYVLPAELVAKALPTRWTTKLKSARTKAAAAAAARGRPAPASVTCNETLYTQRPTPPPGVLPSFWATALPSLAPADAPQHWREFWQEVEVCNPDFGTRWTTEGNIYKLRLRIRTAENNQGRIEDDIDLGTYGPDPGSQPAAQRLTGSGTRTGNSLIVKLPSIPTDEREYWGRAPRRIN